MENELDELATPTPEQLATPTPLGQLTVSVNVTAIGDPRDAETLARQVLHAVKILVPKVDVG